MLNGPNLNLLGTREPGVYGAATLADIERLLRESRRRPGRRGALFSVQPRGRLIDAIHEAPGQADAIVINPGALTHYSYRAA